MESDLKALLDEAATAAPAATRITAEFRSSITRRRARTGGVLILSLGLVAAGSLAIVTRSPSRIVVRPAADCGGQWQVHRTPVERRLPGSTGVDLLYAVSAGGSLWAIGNEHGIDSGIMGVTTRWNGTSLERIEIPHQGPRDVIKDAATDDSSIWIAGWTLQQTATTTPAEGFLMRWSGTRWEQETPRDDGPLFPTAIAVRGSTVAVGGYRENGLAFVMMRTGSGSWQHYPLPADMKGPFVADVALAPDGTLVVLTIGSDPASVLVLEDGRFRRIYSGAPPGTTGIMALSVAATDDMWVSGIDRTRNHVSMEHWDGRTWTPVDLPDIDVVPSFAVRAAGDVWAVGQTRVQRPGSQFPPREGEYTGLEAVKTTFLHWDGTSWSTADANFPSEQSRLWSVDVDASGRGIAVGGGDVKPLQAERMIAIRC
ncbi:MAG TPA: hypothetical protein VM841_13935 [Actinomycetota bacterium]|nr:hypothetical protein [Actinomycetota bacterium]